MIAGVEVTVGSDSDPAAQAVNVMCGKHIAKKVTVSCPVTHAHMCIVARRGILRSFTGARSNHNEVDDSLKDARRPPSGLTLTIVQRTQRSQT